MRVPGNLPEMSIRVREASSISAPELIRGLSDALSACLLGFSQYSVYAVLLASIVGKSETGKSGSVGGNSDVPCHAVTGIKRESEAADLEERDALCGGEGPMPSQALVKGGASFEISGGKRDDADSLLDDGTSDSLPAVLRQ